MKKLLLLAALALPLQAEQIQLQLQAGGGMARLIPGNNPTYYGGYGEEFFISAEAGPSEPDPQGPDLLRFLNGDTIHGTFKGLSKTDLSWGRKDLAAPIQFNTANLAQVAFNGGRIREGLPAPSSVILTNGDRIPGTIVSLDDKTLVLETPMAGSLEIPREALASLFPSPQGGGVLYAGPFNSEGWKILGPDPEDGNGAKEAEPDKFWVHSGAAFYSKSEVPLMRQVGLPDQARLSFHLAWRNRLNASIVFHADFKRPVLENKQPVILKKAEGQKPAELKWETPADLENADGMFIPWSTPQHGNAYSNLYGSSYVLTIQTSYPTLYRCGFNPDGQPTAQAIQTARVPINLRNASEADFDLRIDRKKQIISLYVNGEYVMQWDEPDEFAGTGGGLAFTAHSGCNIRISDIVVSSWNGMTDSARSMVHEDRDILLLTNGTDRFSGALEKIEDGKLSLKNTYSSLDIPIAEVEEIHLHRKATGGDAKEPAPVGSAVLLFSKNGRLTLRPTTSTAATLTGTSALLGELSVDLSSTSLLQFAPGNPALEGWDENF